MTSTAKHPAKLDRRVVRTRKAITDAFDRLVVDRGIDKITISALAREADIDRKTFYLHYASVDDLANSKAEAGMERVIGVLMDTGLDSDPAVLIHVALSEVNTILTEDLDVCAQIAAHLSIEQIMARYETVLHPALEHMGIPVDDLTDIDESMHMRLQFYVAGALSLYTTWLKSDRTTPIQTVSATIERSVKIPC